MPFYSTAKMVGRKCVARQAKWEDSSPSPSPPKKLRFNRSLHKSMITIKVGSGANIETFVMHTELVAHHSTKLARMIDGSIKAEHPGILELPDFEPEDFQIFEAWIYRQQLEEVERTLASATFLYIFADRLGSLGLMNAIMDSMGHMVRIDPQCVPIDPPTLNLIWGKTLQDSPLRALVVDVLAYEMTPKDCCQYVRHFPTDLTIRLLEAMKRRLPGRMKNEVTPFDVSMEQYHVKEAGEEHGVIKKVSPTAKPGHRTVRADI